MWSIHNFSDYAFKRINKFEYRKQEAETPFVPEQTTKAKAKLYENKERRATKTTKKHTTFESESVFTRKVLWKVQKDIEQNRDYKRQHTKKKTSANSNLTQKNEITTKFFFCI